MSKYTCKKFQAIIIFSVKFLGFTTNALVYLIYLKQCSNLHAKTLLKCGQFRRNHTYLLYIKHSLEWFMINSGNFCFYVKYICKWRVSRALRSIYILQSDWLLPPMIHHWNWTHLGTVKILPVTDLYTAERKTSLSFV